MKGGAYNKHRTSSGGRRLRSSKRINTWATRMFTAREKVAGLAESNPQNCAFAPRIILQVSTQLKMLSCEDTKTFEALSNYLYVLYSICFFKFICKLFKSDRTEKITWTVEINCFLRTKTCSHEGRQKRMRRTGLGELKHLW